jgi:hypothetical protein
MKSTDDYIAVRLSIEKYAKLYGDTPKRREAILAQRALDAVAKKTATAAPAKGGN